MRRLASFVLFLLVVGTVNAAVISEATLAELGYGVFSVTGAGSKACTQYTFGQAADLNNAVYVVFSVHASFAPVLEGDANLSVYFNNDPTAIAELGTSDFAEGWARVILPRDNIGEINNLEVCGATSFQITRLDILEDSKIGSYFMPDFSMDGAFTKLIAAREPKIGEEFKIAVTLQNYGSESAEINLRYRRESLDDAMPEIQVIKDRTSLTGTIPACTGRDGEADCLVPGSVMLEYTVNATRAVQMTLLPAILSYENIFGDSIEMESNRQTIRVVQPEINMRAFISSENDTLKTGESNRLVIAVKNEGIDTLYNISFRLQLEQGLEGNGQLGRTIAWIMPDETVEFEFNVSAGSAGHYKIGCDLTYLDYNVVRTECNPVTITYEDPEIDPAIIAAGLLLVIGILVYAYFSFRKV